MFDFMNFSDGAYDTEFVVNAKKYTKEEAIELCISENDWRFENGDDLVKPKLSDIEERRVRFYPTTPDWCSYESGNGCYTYCDDDKRGSFPVWVISFDKLA